MRVVLQRVEQACVTLPGGECRAVGPGLLALVGVGPGDDPETVRRLADKTANLRIFCNEAGKFDRSLLDTGGEALVISQFTLYADCRRGRRPDFTAARAPAEAEPLYRAYAEALSRLGVRVKTGEFGASMQVSLVNDGPVTICLDSSGI